MAATPKAWLFALLGPVIFLSLTYRPLPKPVLVPLVKNLIDHRKNITTRFEYDDNGRVTNVTSSTGTETVYRYTSGTLYKGIRKTNGKGWETDTFLLNENGLAETMLQGGAGWAYKAQYKYTADGYLTEEKAWFNGELASFAILTYRADNKIAISSYSEDGQLLSALHYRYLPGTVNTIGHVNTGMLHMGKASANLVQASYATNTAGDTTATVFYKYAFDEQKRVILKVTTRPDGKLIDSLGYTYW